MYKLVQFVEDRIFHVCENKNIITRNESTFAKYYKHFYPAVILNEGDKKEMLLWKSRYLENDLVLQQYFNFVPTVKNPYNSVIQNTISTQTSINEKSHYELESRSTISTQTTENQNYNGTLKCDAQTQFESSVLSDRRNKATQTQFESYLDEKSRYRSIRNDIVPEINTFCEEEADVQTKSQLTINETELGNVLGEITDSDPDFVPGTESSDSDENLSCDAEINLDGGNVLIDGGSNYFEISEETEEQFLNDSCNSYDGDILIRTSDKNSSNKNTQESVFLEKSDNVSNVQPLTAFNQTKENTKLYFCIYCNSKVSRFARHLQSKHRYEKKVMEFSKFSSGDSRRIAIIDEIRSLGNFEYNTKFKLNNEDMLLTRRPQATKNRTNEDYTPCPKCRNFYRKNLLYRHYRRCGNVAGSVPRTLQVQSRAIFYENELGNKWLINEILPRMLHDQVTDTVKNDKLILAYANYLCERYDGDKHLTNMIRQKMRQLGNFLIHMRKIDSSIKNLDSIFHPQKLEDFVKAVRLCCGYNFVDGSYRTPSLIIAIGILVKDCGERLLVEYAKMNDLSRTGVVEAWLSIYRKEFPLINKRAHQIIQRNKWNKPRILPLTEDIITLNNYLQKQFDDSFQFLQKGFEKSAWNNLSKCCLLLILIFNRKRVGEVEKLLIKDYKNRHNIQTESDFYKSLKESEKIFSKRYMRIEVRGKLGRPVCVMVSNKQVEAIDLLLKLRENANVHFNNPYVFGRDINKYFEGSRSLREASNSCGARNPYLLRGTKLRKHIATVSQALNLTENELAILADFMGHNIEVHRHFYRLPNEAIHLAKISQLLYALDNNMLNKYKGKSLDDINIDDLPNEPIENPTDDNSDETFDTISNAADSDEHLSMEGMSEKEQLSINSNNNAQEDYPSLTVSHTSGKNSEKKQLSPCNKEDWTPDRKRKKVPKVLWRTPEKFAIRKYFSRHLQARTLPSLNECREAQRKYSSLQKRTAIQIKLWINNEIRKRKLCFD